MFYVSFQFKIFCKVQHFATPCEENTQCPRTYLGIHSSKGKLLSTNHNIQMYCGETHYVDFVFNGATKSLKPYPSSVTLYKII